MVAKDELKHHGSWVGHGVVREDVLKCCRSQERHWTEAKHEWMCSDHEIQHFGSQEVRIMESEDKWEHLKSLQVHRIRNGHKDCPLHLWGCHTAKGL